MANKKRRGNKGGGSFRQAIDDMFKNNPGLAELLQKAFFEAGDVRREIDIVTEKDWTLTHPFQLKCGSDRYYAALANELQGEFLKMPFPPFLPQNLERETAMTLAAYLEDIVSGTGVWNSIRDLYKRKYGSQLPFFDCDPEDYFEDDINIEDIKVLVWQTLCRCGQPDNKTYSPLSEAVELMAGKAYNILVDHFEKAPECRRVVDRLKKEFREADFYRLRCLSLWLGVDNKLTAVPDMRSVILERAMDIMDEGEGRFDESQAYYMSEVLDSWKDAVGMLGCPAGELLGEMARKFGFPKTAELLDTVKSVPSGVYSVESLDEKVVVLSNPIGKKYVLDRYSLNAAPDLSEGKTFVGSIVRFGELWQQNGMSFISPREASEFRSERMVVEFPEEMQKKLRQIVKEKKGRRVFYCKDKAEMSELVGNIMEAVPLLENDDEDYDEPDNFVVMISDNNPPLVFPDDCGIFSDRSNPFYDAKADREWMKGESLRIIMTGRIPDDVAAYIQKKHILPHAEINAMQGKRVGKTIVQDNLRFLLGFYRVVVPSSGSEDNVGEDEEYCD